MAGIRRGVMPVDVHYGQRIWLRAMHCSQRCSPCPRKPRQENSRACVGHLTPRARSGLQRWLARHAPHPHLPGMRAVECTSPVCVVANASRVQARVRNKVCRCVQCCSMDIFLSRLFCRGALLQVEVWSCGTSMSDRLHTCATTELYMGPEKKNMKHGRRIASCLSPRLRRICSAHEHIYRFSLDTM